jgi:hypothetical protein
VFLYLLLEVALSLPLASRRYSLVCGKYIISLFSFSWSAAEELQL